MSPRRVERPRLMRRILLIAAALTAMAALILAVAMDQSGRNATIASEAVALQMLPQERIATEADLFLPEPGSPVSQLRTARRATAHPRTLETYRALRAYPGAPPRIPHGLTAEEFRRPRCNACHEGGGYSQRFEAYAPVSPHPEQPACLQCHVTDAEVIGVALPSAKPEALCGQCHAAGGRGAPGPALNWTSNDWPLLTPRAFPDAPPPIPHDVVLRSRCNSCHAGPAAVAEIRTTHPERVACRQCHAVFDASAGTFSRPVNERRKEGAP